MEIRDDFDPENEAYPKDPITDSVIKCVITVHRALGPGFLESIYRNSLAKEFAKQEIRFETEKEVKIYYDGEEVGKHRLDFLVCGEVVVELKTVEQLNRAHYAQVRSYLKATKLTRGLLVNFSKDRSDFRRIEI